MGGCSTVQLKGASGTECSNKKRSTNEWWSTDCELMIIGDAPGWTEDRLKLPFVDKAGDLLFDKFLNRAGIDLDKVYVTSAVKCKPPQERKPNTPAPNEIQACRRHIEWEIRHFKPKVVLLLGNVALKTFNMGGLGGIRNIHGKLFEKKFPNWDDGPTFKVIASYSPSFFLHKNSSSLENRIIRDYIFVNNILEGKGTKNEPFHKPDFKVCETIEDVEKLATYLSSKDEFAFDTESTCLPWYKSPMLCFSFSCGENDNYVLPMHRHDPNGVDLKMKPAWENGDRKKVLDLIRVPFEDENIAKAAHNIKYDALVIKKWCDIDMQGKWWDTMLMHHLLEEAPPHDLEYLSDLEFLTGDYSASKREITGHGKVLKNTYDKVPDDLLHPYAATDAECVWRLKQTYLERMKKKPHILKLYNDETHEILKTLAEAEWYGNKVNRKAIDAMLKEQETRREGILKDMAAIVPQDKFPEFNPGSPDQVKMVLIHLGYGRQITDKSKAKGYCTDKDAMEKLSNNGCEIASLIIKYRSVVKLVSTYLQKSLDEEDDDGRLRFSWLVHGTTTGRLSAPFLHQIPKSNEGRIKEGKLNLRDVFIAEEGYKYIYGDYSQIEMRAMAIIAEDEELKKVFASGQDVHIASASAGLGIPYDEVSFTNRDNIGKKIGFGTIFGSKGHSIAKGTYYEDPKDGKRKKLHLNKVEVFIANFMAKFSGIKNFLEDVPILAASQNGLLTSVFGRDRHLVGLNDPNPGKRAHAEREGINFLIQSPAGAITIRTANAIRKMLRDSLVHSDKIRLINTVHDSLAYEVKDELVDWFSKKFKEIAEREIPELENEKFPVDIGIGSSWGDAEKDSKKKEAA